MSIPRIRLFYFHIRENFLGVLAPGRILRGRVPCTALSGPGALVRQGKQGGNSFHLVCGQLLQHLLVTDPLSESRDNRCIRNTGNGSTYLGEAGDEGPE